MIRALILSSCLALAGYALAQVNKGSDPPADYILGPGDTIMVRAQHAPELPDRPIRIGDDGYLRLPFSGRVKAAGKSAEELSQTLDALFSEAIKEPQVSVELVEPKSHPVSVLGAVKTPGVYQLVGQKRLLEVLSAAGGTDADAGSTVRVSRPLSSGRIPFPGAEDVEGESVAEIPLPDLIEGKHPNDNIAIETGDVVTVPRAKLVYVMGEVKKAGGFVLRDQQSMSVLQGISLAEGLTNVAKPSHAKILRQTANGGDRVEISVDVKAILAGKAEDPMLRAGDILYIPNSTAKAVSIRAMEAAIQAGIGAAIFR